MKNRKHCFYVTDDQYYHILQLSNEKEQKEEKIKYFRDLLLENKIIQNFQKLMKKNQKYFFEVLRSSNGDPARFVEIIKEDREACRKKKIVEFVPENLKIAFS